MKIIFRRSHLSQRINIEIRVIIMCIIGNIDYEYLRTSVTCIFLPFWKKFLTCDTESAERIRFIPLLIVQTFDKSKS